MINDLYIVGDQSRLIVKNIINQLQTTGCNIKIFAPTSNEVYKLPNFSISLLIVLSDNIDFNIIKQIVSYQRKYDYQLCFVGRLSNLSLQDNSFFQHIPSIKLESFNIEPFKLLELMEKI